MKNKIYFDMTLGEAYEWYVDGGISVVCDGDSRAAVLSEEQGHDTES